MSKAEMSPRVLVVDDEAGMREMLSMLLSKRGFLVQEAENGEAALEILEQHPIDVCLSDLRMPKMDGLSFLKTLNRKGIPLPVLVMSAYMEIDTAIEAMQQGAVDYITKPFKAEEIALKISIALERGRWLEEKRQLEAENERLKRQPRRTNLVNPSGIIGASSKLEKLITTIKKVAHYKSTVLLLGESGTGKELLARALHDESTRKEKPFVPINCGAIPETLLESELFGHKKGAFTDASQDKVGLIQEAHEGTLFLDEIAELPVSLQVKLLRFLQEDEIRRVGDNKSNKVDVRVVAATSRPLLDMVNEGGFREDLYYRLNVLQLIVPPLRERRDDIPRLAEHFVKKYAKRLGRPPMPVGKEALRAMMDYAWPGNVRELENTIERAMVLAEGDEIDATVLPEKLAGPKNIPTLALLNNELSIKKATRAIEQELIRRALEKTNGNRTRASEILEISHRALLYKIKEYGLR